MIALLRVLKGVDADNGRTTVVGPRGVVIGRGPEAELRLQDPGVSRAHCRVSVVDGKALLTDAGGAAGTTVNGAAVRRLELSSGDLIRVGNTEIQFNWSDLDEKNTEGWNPPDQAGAGPAAE
jgi:pSer/pThr/pTyr-binding forkhead associated (FHA) protein